METPIIRTDAQKKALEELNSASRSLADASLALRDARSAHDAAAHEYLRAHAAAKALGVA